MSKEVERLKSENPDADFGAAEVGDFDPEDEPVLRAIKAALDGLKGARKELEKANATLKKVRTLRRKFEVALTEASSLRHNLTSFFATRFVRSSQLNLVNEARSAELAKDKNISGWAAINDRARKSNKDADYNTYKERAEAEEKKKKAGGAKKQEYNPFARRPNKPKVLWAVGDELKKKSEDDEEEEAKDDGKASAAGASSLPQPTRTCPPPPTLRRPPPRRPLAPPTSSRTRRTT